MHCKYKPPAQKKSLIPFSCFSCFSGLAARRTTLGSRPRQLSVVVHVPSPRGSHLNSPGESRKLCSGAVSHSFTTQPTFGLKNRRGKRSKNIFYLQRLHFQTRSSYNSQLSPRAELFQAEELAVTMLLKALYGGAALEARKTGRSNTITRICLRNQDKYSPEGLLVNNK